jgi:NADPH-dependent curcumin reductase CurA
VYILWITPLVYVCTCMHIDIGRIKRGQTVVVSGAAGATGSIAGNTLQVNHVCYDR